MLFIILEYKAPILSKLYSLEKLNSYKEMKLKWMDIKEHFLNEPLREGMCDKPHLKSFKLRKKKVLDYSHGVRQITSKLLKPISYVLLMCFEYPR